MARPRPEPGACLIRADPAIEHLRPHRFRQALTIVLDGDDAPSGAVGAAVSVTRAAPTCRRCRAGCRASRRGPAARATASSGGASTSTPARDRRAAARACGTRPRPRPPPRSARPARRLTPPRAPARDGSPPAAACARPARMLAASSACRPPGSRRLLREHRQRRLQAVREIAGLGLRARARDSRAESSSAFRSSTSGWTSDG